MSPSGPFWPPCPLSAPGGADDSVPLDAAFSRLVASRPGVPTGPSSPGVPAPGRRPLGLVAGDQAVDGIIEGAVRRVLSREATGEVAREGLVGQFVGIAEVTLRQRRGRGSLPGRSRRGRRGPRRCRRTPARRSGGRRARLRGRPPCGVRSLPHSRVPSRGCTWDGPGRSRRPPAASSRAPLAARPRPATRRRRPAARAPRAGRPGPWPAGGPRRGPPLSLDHRTSPSRSLLTDYGASALVI